VKRFVVDTNVPVVANGRFENADHRTPSIDCRIATIRFLEEVLATAIVLIDLNGEIQAEYRRHLRPSGQPGVGDRFYQEVLRSAPNRIERLELPKGKDREHIDLPRALVDVGFHYDDRKFAALYRSSLMQTHEGDSRIG
jgi:hypothetical protein